MALIFHLCVVCLFFFLLSFEERKKDEMTNGIPIRGETLIGMRIRNPVSSILWCTQIASSILHNWGEGGGEDSKLCSIFVIMVLLYLLILSFESTMASKSHLRVVCLFLLLLTFKESSQESVWKKSGEKTLHGNLL